MSENDFNLTKANITDQDGNFKPGPVSAVLFVPRDTQITDVSTAMLEATYTTGLTLIMANRWQLVRFDKGERVAAVIPTQDEPKFEDSPFGALRNKVAPGNKRLELVFANLSPYTQKALASLEGQDLDMFEITENNYIRGKSPDKTILEGFTVNQFVGAEVGGENSGVANKFSLIIDYADANENTLKGIHALPTAFQFEDLDGIMDVEITEVSSGTTAIVVLVKTYVGNVPITGLVTDDFKAEIISTGEDVEITGATESSTVSGQYSLAGTFTTVPHYINTTPQPDATNTEVETPDDLRLTTTPS